MKLIKTKTASSFLYGLIFFLGKKSWSLLLAFAGYHSENTSQALLSSGNNFPPTLTFQKSQKNNNGAPIFSANPLFFPSRAPPLACCKYTFSNPRTHSRILAKKKPALLVASRAAPLNLGWLPFSLLQDAHGSAFTVVALELLFFFPVGYLDLWHSHTRLLCCCFEFTTGFIANLLLRSSLS